VSQFGAIVRDNVPISYREWKEKADNPHVVPDSVKNLLNTSHFLKVLNQPM
jgi:hypothetical protein